MKIDSFLVLFAIVIFGVSCNPKHFNTRKILIDEDVSVEWYFVSDLTSDQEFIEFVNLKSGDRELILQGGQVCDVEYIGETLIITTTGGGYAKFDGLNSYHIKIRLDTTCRNPSFYENKKLIFH
jgi:hypothetical protein